MMRIERANSHDAVTWVSLLGLVIVPLVVALGFLATTWGRDARLPDITAAVVNLDQAVTIDGQVVPLGRQLAAAMVERDDANVTWVLSDPGDSAAGLTSGEYAVVVTIPENFSASATSYAGEGEATQATIDVRTGENVGIADADIASDIASLAVDTINSTLTKAYLDNIYVGFGTIGEQFTTVADGARQLADGSTQLSDGVAQASDGTLQLSDGLRQLAVAGRALDAGGTKLVDSSGQVTSGADQLASGAGELSAGLTTLDAGLPALADGVSQLASGSSQLSGGLSELETGLTATSPDWSGLTQLASGAAGVEAGAAGLSGGLAQVESVLQGYASGASTIDTPAVPTPAVPDAALAQVEEEFIAGCVPAMTPQLEAGLTASLTAALTPVVGADAGAMAASMAAEMAGPMASQTCAGVAPGVSSSFESGFGEGFQAGLGGGFAGGVQAGATVGLTALTTEDAASGESLVTGAAALADGASQLSAGVDRLATELPAETAAQTATLVDAVTQLSDGASQLASGTGQLDAKVGDLTDGVSQLASGSSQLATGATQLADGVGAYVDGVTSFAQGSDRYTTGVSEVAVGASTLAAGMVKLDDGATKLAGGLDTFATKLAEGSSDIPSYTQQERESLAEVVTRPIGATPEGASSLLPSAALLSVLALWLGALVTFLVLRPIPSRVLTSSRPSWQLVAAALTPALAIAGVQALLLTLFWAVALDLSPGASVRLLGLLLLAGAVFVVGNHALAAWLHGLGRTISVVLATVAAATGMITAVPEVFIWINVASPLAPALRGVRAVVGDGSGAGAAVGVLLVWLLVGLSASALAVVSKRQLSARQYRKKLAVAAD